MSFSKNTIISLISFLAVLALSFWFWNLQRDIIIGGNIGGAIIIQSMIVFIALLVFAAIELMVGDLIFGVLTALTAPAAIVFYFGFSGMVLLAVIGTSFALGICAYFSAKKEKSDRLKLKISSVKNGLNLYFLAALLALTGVLYQHNFSGGQLKISESMVKQILPMIEGQIKSQIPFYSSEMTSDELLVMMALANGQIKLDEKTLSPSAYKVIQSILMKKIALQKPEDILKDPEIQKLILNDIIKNNPKLMVSLRDDFEEQFGFEIGEKQSLTTILANWLNSLVEKYTDPFKDYLPLALAITFFFSFKFLGSLFVGAALLVAGILLSVLKLVGIIKINKAGVMQEVIES